LGGWIVGLDLGGPDLDTDRIRFLDLGGPDLDVETTGVRILAQRVAFGHRVLAQRMAFRHRVLAQCMIFGVSTGDAMLVDELSKLATGAAEAHAVEIGWVIRLWP
jgi:hypothetical protein